MKKRRTPKEIKLLTFFASLQLLTVLAWEYSLAADSHNAPLPESSKIILWGTVLSVSLSACFWAHLKRQAKKWRRRHIFSGVQKNIAAAGNTGLTNLRN